MVSPFLSGMDIRHVQLYKRDRYTEQGVPDGNRCVCESTRIQYDAISPICARILNPVYDGTLPITAGCVLATSLTRWFMRVSGLTFEKTSHLH